MVTLRDARLLSVIALSAFLSAVASSQDFSRVPGVVVNYRESPLLADHLANVNEIYTASPSITIMPNGYYVACHDLFDSGTTYDTTEVFLSTDRGATWRHQCTVVGQFWSTIFQHKGIVYLFGPQKRGGNLVIRKSTDYGRTFTEPTGPTSGLLLEGQYGGTPNAPAIHHGRIWLAQSGTRVVSAPVDSNLLHADSWTLSGGISSDHGRKHFGDLWKSWTEAQVVASARTGVVLMPKIRNLPYTALLRVDEGTGELLFDGGAPNAFPSLPGGEKKFGACYDPVSERFFVLSNPVLPAEADHPLLAEKHAMIRTTAGVLSSRDLVNWNVEKLFLYTPNIDNGTWGEGFQYFNFAIDGEDLAVVSRTAIDVGEGENKPPRGHDTNLMTFHRIKNFRSLRPKHVLIVDRNDSQISRYELTQHERAPLGSFALGTWFDGEPLTEPVGLAQADSGDVYIREEGGRVLRFDAAGNFINAVTAVSDLSSETRTVLNRAVPPAGVRVDPPARGECTWVRPESGKWSTAANWFYWGRPDTNDEIAVFGSAATANCVIDVDGTFTTNGLLFRGKHKYTIDGNGCLTIASGTGRGMLEVQQGIHDIQIPLKLATDTNFRTATNTKLTLRGSLALQGRHLAIAGTGCIVVGGPFSMAGGVLRVDGRGGLIFADGTDATLDGTLAFELPEEAELEVGTTYQLVGGVEHVSGRFEAIELPQLSRGLTWDASALYRDGTVSIRTSESQ